MSIRIINPGITSVQDLGRVGWQRYGVTPGGAMDPYALRIANLLVGNKQGDAALEIGSGLSLVFEQDGLLSLSGGIFAPAIAGRPIPYGRPVLLKKGQILRLGKPVGGRYAYLAVAGGLGVPLVLGSKSTHLKAELGGVAGRLLKKTDFLPWGEPSPWALRLMAALKTMDEPFAAVKWTLPYGLPALGQTTIIRAVTGPQSELFTVESRESFYNSSFTVTSRSDRMGYSLAGPKLSLECPGEMLSEAVTCGTIQVPPDGMPIVLMADRQTTGGYPKIAQVISVDIPVLAQVQPGQKVAFYNVSIKEAEELLAAAENRLAYLGRALELKEREYAQNRPEL